MTVPWPVELYRRQYFQLIDPQRLRIPPPDVLILPQTQKFIYTKMFYQSERMLLPPLSYQYRVLKLLLVALQDSFQDSEEDVRQCLHSSLGRFSSNSFPRIHSQCIVSCHVPPCATKVSIYPTAQCLPESQLMISANMYQSGDIRLSDSLF